MNFEIPDLTQVPTRYILSDSEDDEYYPAPASTTAPSPIVVKLGANFSTDVQWTLVVGVHGGGNALLNSVKAEEKEVVGAVIVPGIDLKTNFLDLSSTSAGFILHHHKPSLSPTLILPCNSPLTPQQSFRFVRELCSHIKLQRVILLDTFPSFIYTDRNLLISPPLVYSLQTTTAKPYPTFATYKPPNLTTNLTAAFLSYCEIHNLVAYAFLIRLEATFGRVITSNETLQAMEKALEVADVHLSIEASKISEQKDYRLYL